MDNIILKIIEELDPRKMTQEEIEYLIANTQVYILWEIMKGRKENEHKK